MRLYDHAHKLHELEPHYSAHVSAMTSEGLHGKSDIAAELAWRDQQIARLTAFIADIHRALGRGTHGTAEADCRCAVSALGDVLQASRENSEESARLEERLATVEEALRAANAIIGEQADEAKRLQDTIDSQQKTLRSLAEHEPSWSDDFLRARAALIGVEATLAGKKVEPLAIVARSGPSLCRHCKSPHAGHNARLDYKCPYQDTTYEPEDEKP